jgi:hypothetical protein
MNLIVSLLVCMSLALDWFAGLGLGYISKRSFRQQGAKYTSDRPFEVLN